MNDNAQTYRMPLSLLLASTAAVASHAAEPASEPPKMDKSPVARIEVTPSSPVVATCEAVHFKAVALDAAGAPVPEAVIRVQFGRAPFLGTSCDGIVRMPGAMPPASGGPTGPRQKSSQLAINGEASITAPANPIRTSVTFTALVEGAPPVVFKQPLEVVAGPAARLDVVPVPKTLVAGSSLRPEIATWAASNDPRLGDKVLWSSSAPDIVRTGPEGELAALRPGRATLTATSGSFSRDFPVTVIGGDLKEVAIVGPAATIRTGDYIKLAIAANDRRGKSIDDITPRWSFAPGEGILDADGGFVPYKPGQYRITADLGAQKASLLIDVVPRDVRRPGRVVGAVPVSGAWTAEVAVHPKAPIAYFSLLDQGKGFSVDVSDPANPRVVDSFTVNARTSNDLTISEDGKVLVISREGAEDRRNGISIFTLDDPLHPKKAADLTEGVASGVHSATIHTSEKYGRLAYLTNIGKMVVVDLNDPAKPKIIGRYVHPGLPHDYYVEDGIVFASWIGEGLLILDVGNGIKGGTPSNPKLITHYKYDLAGALDTASRELGAPVIGGTHAAFRRDKYLVLGDEIFNDAFTGRDAQAAARAAGKPSALSMPERFWSSIQILDITDIEKPRAVAWYAPEFGGVHNFWIEGNLLYAATFNAGVRVFDISGDLRGDLREQGREIMHVNTVDWQGRRPNAALSFSAIPKDGLIYSTDINNGFFISKIGEAYDPGVTP